QIVTNIKAPFSFAGSRKEIRDAVLGGTSNANTLDSTRAFEGFRPSLSSMSVSLGTSSGELVHRATSVPAPVNSPYPLASRRGERKEWNRRITNAVLSAATSQNVSGRGD